MRSRPALTDRTSCGSRSGRLSVAGSTVGDMTQQGVRWTADQVLALAPDAASRKAGSKLGAAGPWSEAGSSDEGAVWGLCKGSGSKPYQTVVDTRTPTGPAYKCSCPSRKFPCKHALGLLLLWAGGGRHGAGGRRAAGLGRAVAGRSGARAGRGGAAEAGGAAPRPLIREAARPQGGAPGRAGHGGGDGAGAAPDRPAARRHSRRPSRRGTGCGRRRRPAWSTRRRPDWPRGYGSWGPSRLRARLAGAAAGGVRAAASARPGLARPRAAAGRRWPPTVRSRVGLPAPGGRPAGAGPLAGPRAVRHGGQQAHHPPHLAARHGIGSHARCSSRTAPRAAPPNSRCRWASCWTPS